VDRIAPDEFDKGNQRYRRILESIKTTADKLVPYEETFEQKYSELDGLINDSDLVEMEVEKSDGFSLVDILMGKIDEDLNDYHNPLMLYYQINTALFEIYEL